MSERGVFASPSHQTESVHTDSCNSESVALAERLAFDHGESYDSYLLLDEGRESFFSAQGTGVVSFVRWRRCAYVIGGLLTPEDNKRQLLQEFLDFTTAERLEPLFFNVLASDLPLYREHGLQITKVGEEPIIDLRETTFRGKRYEWVRRQENLCLKNGVTVREIVADSDCSIYQNRIVPELIEVSDEHLRNTVFGRELALMVGRFTPLAMHRKRLFVAESNNRIEGFVAITPAYAGRYWAIEMYRRRPDAARGVITGLFMQIARCLQDEGAQVLSLCQVPGLRSSMSECDDSRLVRNGLDMWWKHVSWLYDPARLYHFKSRFRPDYRELYLAGAKPKFIPMLAFALKWGVVWPDIRRLPTQMLRRIKKWKHRERLADPMCENYRIIDQLCLDDPKPPRKFAPKADVKEAVVEATSAIPEMSSV